MRVLQLPICLLTLVSATTLVVADEDQFPGHDTAPQARTPVLVDFDETPVAGRQLRRHLRIGGDVEVEYTSEKNFDLDRREPGDLGEMEYEASLSLDYRPRANIRAYLNLNYLYEDPVEQEEKGEDREAGRDELEIKRAFIEISDWIPPGQADLTLGRQRIEDEREWLYDAAIDAIRVDFRALGAEHWLAAGWEGVIDADLLNHQPDDQINNYFYAAEFELQDNLTLIPSVTWRDQETGNELEILYPAVAVEGSLSRETDFWVNAAYARGRERLLSPSEDVSYQFSGWGYDLGFRHQLPGPWSPILALGFAHAPGDESDPGDRIYEGFRQTGLQDNSDKVTGISSVKYYGELFDPELHNIRIFTVAFGIRPSDRTSVELVFHHYRQDQAASRIRNSDIDARPSGEDPDLGRELNMILAARDVSNWDAELLFGAFWPSEAFDADERDTAYLSKLKVRYRF